jgi:HD superfamily phosphodiesterase
MAYGNYTGILDYKTKLMNVEKLKKFITDKFKTELSDKLTYHGIHHTESVLKNCQFYAGELNISENDAFLLYTAALMHDIGFTKTYDNHEEASVIIAKKILPEWNYSEKDIETIIGIIMATKIPQRPGTILEKIIGDSDLDYLGTDRYYSISETLFKELLAFNKITDRKQWDEIQIRFLQNHRYHTDFALKYREPVKQKYLKDLLEKQKQDLN